ncbi:MAG: hypothetical protein ACFFCS_08230 [Candidatus Hodarchaeota archaeon]
MTILTDDDDALKLVFKGWDDWRKKFVRMLSKYNKAPDVATKKRIAVDFMEKVEIPAWAAIKDDLIAAIAPEIKNLETHVQDIMTRNIGSFQHS